MVLKLSSQKNPQGTKKKVSKNKIQNQKLFQKCDLTIFGSIKNLFWFSLLEPFQEVLKKEFLIEPLEMVQGNLKSQKGSLLNQNIQRLLWTTLMHYNGQKWANFKAMSRG